MAGAAGEGRDPGGEKHREMRDALSASPFSNSSFSLPPPVGWTRLEAGAEEPGKGSWANSALHRWGEQRKTRKCIRGQKAHDLPFLHL